MQRKTAAGAEQPVEPQLDAAAQVFTKGAERRSAKVLADAASNESGKEVPPESARIAKPLMFQLGARIAGLEHDLFLQGPADHRLVGGQRLFDQFLVSSSTSWTS